jgi:hypothetical protein
MKDKRTSKTTLDKQRKYVYEELGKKIKGKHMSNLQKSKLMEKLWKRAKREYK